MSKQFQVFLIPSDAVALVEELRARFGARVLSKKSPTSDPVEMESPIRHESIFEASGATSIYCYVAPANGRIITNYYPTLRLWLVDTSSEAIEFSGCDFDGKTLLVGRFYFQTDDLVDGSIVKKRAEFLEWADRVFRYTKKVLRRDRELMAPLGGYVGKEALIFQESGGRFAESIWDAGVRISRPVAPDSPPRVGLAGQRIKLSTHELVRFKLHEVSEMKEGVIRAIDQHGYWIEGGSLAEYLGTHLPLPTPTPKSNSLSSDAFTGCKKRDRISRLAKHLTLHLNPPRDRELECNRS